ncbi:MAG: hypothetical protein ABSB41_18850, partial [Anaerolineales bacterium]
MDNSLQGANHTKINTDCATPHCLKLNVTLGRVVASRRMLPYGREKRAAGGEHDESTKQAG